MIGQAGVICLIVPYVSWCHMTGHKQEVKYWCLMSGWCYDLTQIIHKMYKRHQLSLQNKQRGFSSQQELCFDEMSNSINIDRGMMTNVWGVLSNWHCNGNGLSWVTIVANIAQDLIILLGAIMHELWAISLQLRYFKIISISTQVLTISSVSLVMF